MQECERKRKVMLQHIYFELKSVDRFEDEENVKLLNRYLCKCGIKVEIEEQQGVLEKHNYLSFKFDSENVEKKMSRDAGKHRKMVRSEQKEGFITLGQVKELQKKKKNDEIIEKLDISRATFYRRLKEHKEKKTRDDETF